MAIHQLSYQSALITDKESDLVKLDPAPARVNSTS